MKRTGPCVILAIILLACSRAEDTPGGTLRQYLDAIAAGDIDRAKEFVSAGEAAVSGRASLRDAESAALAFGGTVQFEIGQVHVEGDTATASVTVRKPELTPEDGLAILEAAVARDDAAKNRALERARTRPKITSTEEYRLVREDGVWRVSPGWLQARKEFDEGVARAKKAVEDGTRYAAQIPVTIDIVRKAAADPNARIVEGKIANRTRATITRLDIVLEYRDSTGQIVHEDSNHPVLSQRYGDENSRAYAAKYAAPIPPGEWREVSYLVPEDIAGSWNGKVTGRVTEVEFEGEP